MVQRRVQALGQLDHRPGAVDVGGALGVVVGGDVVDRTAVHDVVDGAELGDGLVAEPEVGGGEVADQRFGSLTPLGGQAFEPGERLAAHQHPHLCVALAGQERGHDAAANEPGTAGNDIAHASHGHPVRGKGQQGVT